MDAAVTSNKFPTVQNFCVSYLGCSLSTENVYLFLKLAFCPASPQKVSILQRCSQVLFTLLKSVDFDSLTQYWQYELIIST